MAAAPNSTTPGVGRSPLLFIFLTVFIDLLGFGIVIPLLPIYSKAYHASDLQNGLLFASFSGMQFLFAPLWGRVSDRIGRKPVLVGGLLGTAGAYVLFANAEPLADFLGANPMAMLFAARLLAGFFGANISTAQAYIADVTTPANRAKGMGMIGAAFGLGFTLGPWIGGELTHVSVEAPGYAAAALSLCAALFGWLRLVEPPRASGAASRVFGGAQLAAVWRTPRLSTLFLLSFLSIFAFSAFESTFARYGLARFPTWFGVDAAIENASFEQIMDAAPLTGRYLGVLGVISALIQGGLIRRLLPRYGETLLSTVGLAVLGLGLAIVAFAPTFPVVILGCVVMPIGFGLNTPSLNGLISRASPEEQQGAYLGLNQSVASVARMCGPAFAGAAAQYVGVASPFWFAAAVLAVGALIAWRYRARFGATFAR
ncbi:MAG: MFS transporter [Planctomycetota bacterium]|nr:MAG: MFS transporter [Planctomycetota bacterium]